MENHEELNVFINGLSKILSTYGADVGVIQFGSSVNEKLRDKLDVDLLLLSSTDHYGDNFYKLLNQLKSDMIEGNSRSGFPVEAPTLKRKVSDYINEHSYGKVNYIPAFIFGPLISSEPVNTLPTVFLHFKGPVTLTQFGEFCVCFPFHGKSIIFNSKNIVGKLDRNYFDRLIKIDKAFFTTFAVAFQLRLNTSNNLIEIKKCIKKLAQNYYLFKGVFKLSENDLKKKLKSDFGAEPTYIDDLNKLKNIFNEILEQMLIDIQ